MSCCDHAHPARTEIRANLIWAIALNALFIVAQVFYGLQANSLAILADAGHNLGDVLGLILAAVAVWLALVRPNREFSYGLQSTTILAALGQAMLMLLAFFEITHEAIERLIIPPQEAPDQSLMLWVSVAAVIVNVLTVLLLRRGDQKDLNISGMTLHLVCDALVSVGVIVGAVLIGLTHWVWLDPAIGLLIGGFILFSTWRLLRRAMRLALQGVPSEIEAHKIEALLKSFTGVKDVHDMHIWALGTRKNALSAHLVMPGGHPGDAFIEEVGRALKSHGIGHATLQIELGDAASCKGCGCEH